MKTVLWNDRGIVPVATADAAADYAGCVALVDRLGADVDDEEKCTLTIEEGCRGKAANRPPPQPRADGGPEIDLGLEFACVIGDRFSRCVFYR